MTEKETIKFRVALRKYHLTEAEIDEYINLKERLVRVNKTPKAKLMKMAKSIKPLVRVCNSSVHEFEKVFRVKDGDDLVFTRFYDLMDSYLYHFDGEDSVVKHSKKPIPVKNPQKVGEFTCYFDFHGMDNEFFPCLDDVLCQLPEDINPDEVDAFEVVFDCNDPDDAYDVLLDRYEGTVVLYKLPDGLPQQVKAQPVKCSGLRA